MSEPIVVLLNWNGWGDTLACLDSLFDGRATPCRVLVCDNDSHDESVAKISAWGQNRFGNLFERITRNDVDRGVSLRKDTKLALIENGTNLGFAAGNNVGVRLAMRSPDCQYVWLLNNDTTVAPDALAEVIARTESDPSIGLCGSTLVYHHDQQMVQALGGAVFNRFTGRSRHIGAFLPLRSVPTDPAPTERAMSYVIGAAMLVRRAYLEQIGLMQEDYFLYYEEIDWCTRGKDKFRLGYAPNSLVFHKEGASIGTAASGGSNQSLYYLFRSRVRFTARFFPYALPTVLVFCAVDILKFLLKQKFSSADAALRGVLQLQRRQAMPDTSK
jgi:GT2 family glycosyltransferase